MPTIPATCPQCESQYQVDPALIGKRMRCPNAICRAVFEVKDPAAKVETQAPASPGASAPRVSQPTTQGSSSATPQGSPTTQPLGLTPQGSPTDVVRPGQASGSVSDFVPLLPGAAVAPAARAEVQKPAARMTPARPSPPDKPVASAPARDSEQNRIRSEVALHWQTAPPPVRGQAVDEAMPSNAAVLAAPDFAELEGEAEASGEEPLLPADVAGSSLADAVELRGLTPPGSPLGELADGIVPQVDGDTHTSARRRSLGIILLLVVVLAGVGVAALYLIQSRKASDEAERFQLALEAYKKPDYAQTVTLLQGLIKDFPSSPKREEYRFLAALSDLRAAVARPSTDPDEVSKSLDRVLEFLETYKNDALLGDRHGDVWQTLEHLTKDLTALAAAKHSQPLLARARAAWTEAGKFKPPPEVSLIETKRFLNNEFSRVDKDIADKLYRDQGLAFLRGLTEKPSADALEAAWSVIESRKLQDDDEAAKLLAALKTAHRAAIVYVPVDGERTTKPPGVNTTADFAVATIVQDGTTGARDAAPLLALARGVLYVLDPQRGDIRWTRRLGIDSRHLPVRYTASRPEAYPTGAVHPTSAYATPDFLVAIAADEQAVVALELATGRELWRHSLLSPSIAPPIPCTVGDGAQLLLVPMTSGRVDEIDPVSGRLAGFYELGQPLTHGGVQQSGTSLVYLPAVKTCLYVLDVAKKQCAQVLYLRHSPGSLQGMPLIIAGTRADADKPASPASLVVSLAQGDGAVLRRFTLPLESADATAVETVSLPSGHSFAPLLMGDRLAIAGDDGSFTLLGLKPRATAGTLFYSPLADATFKKSAGPGAPALIVHGDTRRWWVLRRGKLESYQVGLSPQEGLKLISLWDAGAPLGTPLHEGQVIPVAPGKFVLFTVTQAPDEPTCLASAVDPERPVMLWQRQLGVICQGPVLVHDKKLLVHDPRGLFALSPSASAPETEPTATGWSSLNAQHLQAIDPNHHHLWLSSGDGPTLLAWPPSGPQVLQAHLWRKGKLTTRTWKLSAAPLGTPAWHGDDLVVPLADGSLVALVEGKKEIPLVTWRGPGVDDKLPGHVVSCDSAGGKGLLAVTDGNRTLKLFHWADSGTGLAERGKHLFDQRIVAAPAVVAGKKLALAIADAAQQLHFLDLESLDVRPWSLPGKISAGPVTRGSAVLCIVGKNRLVWIDPERKEIAGQHLCHAQIVGLPELVDGDLVVADLSGRVAWLDSNAGLTLRRSFHLEPHVVPVSTPTAWLGRVLLPLSDGTLMGLPAAAEGKGMD